MEAIYGAAGLISLGLTVCNGIVRYYSSFKSANATIGQTLASVKGLEENLKLLLPRIEDPALSQDVITQIGERMQECAESFLKLQKVLKKIDSTPQEDTLKAKTSAFGKRTLYPFKESTLAKLRENCGEAQTTLSFTMGVLQLDVSIKSGSQLEALRGQQTDIYNAVNTIDQNLGQASSTMDALSLQESKERSMKLYEWLSPLLGKAETKHNECLNMEGRQDRYAHALMNSSEFCALDKDSAAILWLTGANGTGKTVIASIVINALQQRCTLANAAVTFTYFNYTNTEDQSPANVMAALCQQLLTQCPADGVKAVEDLHQRHAPQKTRPSMDEYIQLLCGMSRYFTNVYVVLDALDESPQKYETRPQLLTALKKLQDRLSLVIFSRPLPELYDTLPSAKHLTVKSQDQDIACYVIDRLSRSENMQKHFVRDPNLKQRILDVVTSKSRGMFLMARLYLDSITSKDTRRQIKAKLDSLPDGLTAAYDDAIDRIKAQDQFRSELALRMIHWIYFACSPLTIAEIKHALAVEENDTELDPDGIPEEDQLISSCVGMVVINAESGIIGFVHFTVQEYFDSHGRGHFKDPVADIAQTCLTYLLFDDLRDAEPKYLRHPAYDNDYPLLQYSSRHWGDHARSCQGVANVEKLTMLYLKQPRGTFQVKSTLDTLVEASRVVTISGSTVSALSIAASYGLNHIVEKLLEQSPQTNLETRTRALQIAVLNDYPDVVSTLSHHNADVNSKDSEGWRPLHNAIYIGSNSMVKLLLELSAHPQVCDDFGETPLYFAAEWGQTDIVRMLSEDGRTDIDSVNEDGQTAAHVAATFGRTEALRVLVDAGADLGIKDKSGHDPRQKALYFREKGVVDMLDEMERRRALKG